MFSGASLIAEHWVASKHRKATQRGRNLRHEFAVNASSRDRAVVSVDVDARAAALATIRLVLLLTEYGRKRRGGR